MCSLSNLLLSPIFLLSLPTCIISLHPSSLWQLKKTFPTLVISANLSDEAYIFIYFHHPDDSGVESRVYWWWCTMVVVEAIVVVTSVDGGLQWSTMMMVIVAGGLCVG